MVNLPAQISASQVIANAKAENHKHTDISFRCSFRMKTFQKDNFDNSKSYKVLLQNPVFAKCNTFNCLIDAKADNELISFKDNEFYCAWTDKKIFFQNISATNSQYRKLCLVPPMLSFDKDSAIWDNKPMRFLENNDSLYIIGITIDSVREHYISFRKTNFLPVQFKEITIKKALKVTQILETSFFDFKTNKAVTDTFTTLEQLKNEGYTLAIPKVKSKNTAMNNIAQTSIDSLFKSDLRNITNKNITIAGDSVQFYLFDFWHLGCLPCLQTMPKIDEISKTYTKVKVIGIDALDSDNQAFVINKLRQANISYPTYFINKDWLKKLNITAFPTYWILNAKKQLVFTGIGTAIDIETEIKKLLDKTKP